ncbi:MAG: flagellar export protein FliJ [Proteobacteria bacterium]|nr:flagellar export protein FliJ [Pseudomonadota bacterium]
MLKSKRFEPIRAIASNAAGSLQQAMTEAEAHLADMERQLAELTRYRSEYLTSPVSSPGSVDTVRLLNFRSFLSRLSEAIRLQGEAVSRARAEYERRRQQWSAKRVEAEVLGKAVERFRQDERRVQDRRDQNESDDASMRRLSMRGAGSR